MKGKPGTGMSMPIMNTPWSVARLPIWALTFVNAWNCRNTSASLLKTNLGVVQRHLGVDLVVQYEKIVRVTTREGPLFDDPGLDVAGELNHQEQVGERDLLALCRFAFVGACFRHGAKILVGESGICRHFASAGAAVLAFRRCPRECTKGQ